MNHRNPNCANRTAARHLAERATRWRPWHLPGAGYAIAVIAVAAAFLLRQALTTHVGETLPTYITFYPAVIITALLGGMGPGLLATALTIAVVDYWVASPRELFFRGSPAEIAGVLLFSAMGVMLAVVTEVYRRTRARAAVYERELALRESREALDKTAEQHRLALEAANLGTWHYNFLSGEVSWDERCRTLFGVAQGDRIDYQKAIAIIHEDDRARVDGAVQGALARGSRGGFQEEYRVVWPDGSLHWVSAKGQVYFQGEGAERKPVRFIGTVLDVSEAKRAEEALRESEARFRAMFELASVGIVAADPATGRLLRFNDKYCQITGYSAEELSAITFPELTHPEDRARDWDLFCRAVRGETPDYRNEKRYVRKDGSIIWVRLNAALIRDGTGRVVRSVAACEDITDRKRSEQERESTVEMLRLVNESGSLQELVRAAIRFFQKESGCEAVAVRLHEGDDFPYYEAEGFPAGFLAAENRLSARDGGGRPLRGPGGCSLLECICGWAIRGCLDASAPCVTAGGSFCTNSLSDLLSEGVRPPSFPGTAGPGHGASGLRRNRCQREGYESVALLPLRVGSERVGLLQLNDRRKGCFSAAGIAFYERLADSLAVAVSRFAAAEALQQSESFYRQTLESIPGMTFTTRPDGYCDYQSQQWVRFTGVPLNEHLGDGWNKLLHPEDQPRALAAWRAAVEERAPYELEYRVRRHDGVFQWFKVIGQPIRDTAGHIVRWFGVALNIEDLKRAEDRINQSLREKNILLQEIHHRVKNNLQVISSLINLQAGTLEDPVLQASLGDVRDRVRTMALVHEKLYQSEDLSGLDFADYAASLLRSLWRAHGEAAGSVRLNLAMEPVRLPIGAAVPCGLILNELATNALKHAFAGRPGGEVTVGLSPDPAHGIGRCSEVPDESTAKSRSGCHRTRRPGGFACGSATTGLGCRRGSIGRNRPPWASGWSRFWRGNCTARSR